MLDDAPFRSLTTLRHAATTLAAAGWSVLEAAAFSAGAIDVLALRSWQRPPLRATLRLLIHGHASAGQLLFSATTAPASEGESLPHFAIGEDDGGQRRALAELLARHGVAAEPVLAALHAGAYARERAANQPARLDPRRLAIEASSFRGTGEAGPSFRETIDAAFAAIEALRGDLLQHEIARLEDDLEAMHGDGTDAMSEHAVATLTAAASDCDLLHSVVITDTPIALLTDGDALSRPDAIRLLRPSAVDARRQWLDVVSAASAEPYLEALTRHYDVGYRRRHFQRV